MTPVARALAALSVTVNVAYGASFYAFGLTAPRMAADLGLPKSFVYLGFSLSLICSGLVAPIVGRAIDRHGGRVIMAAGSTVTAAAFSAFATMRGEVAFLGACGLAGLGMAMTLYEAAFATLAWLTLGRARRAITLLTLAAGFASTIFWPLTQFLLAHGGWREAYLVYAATQLLLCAPLHLLVLPRAPAAAPRQPHGAEPETPANFLVGRARRIAFALFAVTLISHGFLSNGIAIHLFPALEAMGAEPAVIVAVGALFGPAQVAARLADLLFGRVTTPALLGVAAYGALPASLVLLTTAPFGFATLLAFALLYGAGNGLATIARGVIPLALFGRAGYGGLLGLLAAPALFAMASAPALLSLVWSGFGVGPMLWVCAGFAALAFGAMLTLILRFRAQLA